MHRLSKFVSLLQSPHQTEQAMNRRENLALIAGATAMTAGLIGSQAIAQPQPAPDAAFKLPALGYAYDALEPHIDTATMRFHHDFHHAAYVNACNQLVPRWRELATTPMETILADLGEVPEALRDPVRNNLGGDWNHTFFWILMTPGGAKQPNGDLNVAINSAFGSYARMTEQLTNAALGRFGSGWAWLVVNKSRRLDIISTANQDTPLELGARPVIGVDVWEHAYYLKHQNRRPEYLKAWWNVVNWDKALANFKNALA
jgi:Fe-Mn family superoxide dismutase